MKLIYKTLFEVKILHEFYQTDRSGNNIFDLGTQSDRLIFLRNKYESNDLNINADLQFEIPESFVDVFKNYALKLIPTYSGFKILISVLAKKMPNGTTSYEPIHKLPDDLLIPIILFKKNSSFSSFTNNKMENQLNSFYLFSNDNIFSGNRSFPYLTSDIADYDSTKTYEHGELAKFGTNDFKFFYWDSSNSAQWMSITGKAFANENDSILLSVNSFYSFPKTNNISKADFILKDHIGNVVQEFHFKNTSPYSKVLLSFDPKLLMMLPGDQSPNKSIYTLEVTGNGGYHKTHKVLFFRNESELKNSIGLVSIKVKSSLNGFKLFDGTGKLITRKNQFNIMDPAAPVFEINFKSKYSFWRYINNHHRALQNGLHSDLLISTDGVLVSKTPKSLTSNTTLFRKPDNTLFYLPNPAAFQTTSFENNKIYSDIMVQESTLFPLAP